MLCSNYGIGVIRCRSRKKHESNVKEKKALEARAALSRRQDAIKAMVQLEGVGRALTETELQRMLSGVNASMRCENARQTREEEELNGKSRVGTALSKVMSKVMTIAGDTEANVQSVDDLAGLASECDRTAIRGP